MRPFASLLLAAAMIMLVAPAGAGASTVVLQQVQFCTDTWSSCRYMDYSLGVVLRYDGELAERNRVLVRRDGDALLVSDAGAALRPGDGCVAFAASTARCDLAGTPLVGYRLDGNDGDDAIAISGGLSPSHAIAQPRLLLGGAGSDDLIDGTDSSTLAGGSGTDRLSGGEGADRFFGFEPGDAAESAERDDSASDIVDGGPGTDSVDYRARTRDLSLTLSGARPGGGERGEDDRLQHVEVLFGGRGADHIVGGAGADRLEGNGGADRLRGEAGNDELIGGLGEDDLRGGRGDDRIGTSGGGGDGTDRASCGSGRDVVGEFLPDEDLGDTWHGPDATDVFSTDCEGVAFVSELDVGRDIRLDPRPRRRGRTWTFANPCAQAGMQRCRGRLDIAVPGANPFARVRFAATGRVTVRLGRRNAGRIARGRRVSLRVTAQELRRSGARRAAAFTLSLPARR